MRPALDAAKARAAKRGRRLAFVSFVCGTAGDPQGYDRQVQALKDAGVLVAPSNAAAVALAARLVQSRQPKTPPKRSIKKKGVGR